MRLYEEGADVTIASREAGVSFTGKHGLTATSDVAAREVATDAIDAVIVLGG